MNRPIATGIVIVLVIAAVIVFAMNQRAEQSAPAPVATSTAPLATSTPIGELKSNQ